MKMLKNWLLVTIIAMEGCSTSDLPYSGISDRSYFPLRVGNYHIYQVNETDIDHRSCDDDSDEPTKTYELKELTYDSVINPDGSCSYLIYRYTRDNSTLPWQDLDTWSARITNSQAIVYEGNTPYIKLVFPLKNNAKWNANRYNNLQVTTYDTLKNLGQAYQLGTGEKYPATLTVSHDDGNFITAHDKRFEVYAASVGLIYKATTHFTYLQGPCVESGIISSQTLKSSGRQ